MLFFSKQLRFFSPFHALNHKILNKSIGVAEVNYTQYTVVLDPEKNDLSSKGHLIKQLFIAVFGTFT
jgi:hypothetical protein